jgi:two-component system cell cycle response regulator
MRKKDANTTFAVMVADLDHFKRINDTYGHAAGDAVLRHVAEALGRQLVQNDLVARIGGEEFLIVLPDTTRFKTHHVARSLCKAVGSLALPLSGQAEKIAVTISIGVTLSNVSDRPSMPIDAHVSSLLEQADQALYRSKACGRNTVTLAARSAA